VSEERSGSRALSALASDRTLAPLVRRLLNVTGSDELGAYRVLRAADPDGPGSALAPVAGQFAMLSAAERWGAGEEQRPFLARAFSIARHANGESHFLLEDVGPGTRRLCELRAGDRLSVLGPLGRGFAPAQEGRRAILVGGGVGIAPLAILQDQLLRAGASAVVLLGFRDREHAHGAALLQDARVASDDGSVGHHGLVTELLAAELDEDAHAAVYACGPPGMLEGVRALCAQRHTPAQLALEAGMACGFGACYGCVVPTHDGGYLRVCVDGPVVDAAELERVEEPLGAAHIGGPA
jgi:dihydroorotate dehydrogenase electron transfer subunit